MVITNVKIYGERHSGTNFLTQLIQNNFKIDVIGHLHNTPGGWKHSPGKEDNLNKKNTLIIVIFRDAEKWIKALFRDPWHVHPRKNIDEFIQYPLLPGGMGIDENKLLIKENNYGMKPFDMRIHKTRLWCDLKKNNYNVLYVHLDTFQSNNTNQVLQIIHDTWKLPKKTNEFRDIKHHVKTKQSTRERIPPGKHLNEISMDLLNQLEKSPEEKFIISLKKFIIYNVCDEGGGNFIIQ